MTQPKFYGIFHIISIILVIAITTIICKLYKDADKKTFNRIILISWIIMFAFEIYKQIIYSFNYIDNQVIWSYSWEKFPYQFCSTPMYLLPFIVFLKDGKVKDSIMSFIQWFAIFGGIMVYILPDGVFTQWIGINIQTMVHHGIQIIIGVYLMVYNSKDNKSSSIKYYASGIIVFVVMVTIAVALNIIIPEIVDLNGQVFNMFFIGPKYPTTLAILRDYVYPYVSRIVFIVIYIVGFSIVAFLIYLIYNGIDKLIKKIRGCNE